MYSVSLSLSLPHPLSFCPSTPPPSLCSPPPPHFNGLAGTEGMTSSTPLFPHELSMWSPHGTVFTGGTHGDPSLTQQLSWGALTVTLCLTGSSVQVTGNTGRCTCGSLFKFRSKCRPPKKTTTTTTPQQQQNNNTMRRQDIFIIIIIFCSFIHVFNCINLFVLIVV